MIEQRYTVAGDPVIVRTLEHEADLEPLRTWFRQNGNDTIACDTEGTGLNPYAAEFEIRHTQFGNGREAWVLPMDRFVKPVTGILNHQGYNFSFHNFPYDGMVFDALGIAKAEDLAPRVTDTKIRAHLADPRPAKYGGPGLSLKGNSAWHVDSGAPDTQKDLNAVFKNLSISQRGEVVDLSDMDIKAKTKLRAEYRKAGNALKAVGVQNGWRHIPLFHPIYTLYAGLDVILTYRLNEKLVPIIKQKQEIELDKFEHEIMQFCLDMQIRGCPIDVEYFEQLSIKYDGIIAQHEAEARKYGVDKVASSAQVAEALIRGGVQLTKKTKEGNWTVDSDILEPLAAAGNPIAVAVVAAKRAQKWQSSYINNILASRDSNDIIHPNIQALQAETGRSSITNPAVQTLPGGDHEIRSGFVGGQPGWSTFSADMDQVEMRVAGAIAGEQHIIEAAKRGESQHKVTSRLFYGENYTDHQYKLAKSGNFLWLFGGGPDKLSLQTGVDVKECREFFKTFGEQYKTLVQYKRRRQEEVLEEALSSDELRAFKAAQQDFFDARSENKPAMEEAAKWRMKNIAKDKYAWVRTPIGRVLAVPADRAYKILNTEAQSTARDVLYVGTRRAVKAGYGEYIRLPIHDELYGVAPDGKIEEVARGIADCMTTEFRGAPLTAEPTVYGKRWGFKCRYDLKDVPWRERA